MSGWEQVGHWPSTLRFAVPGGWLYRIDRGDQAPVFVPDPRYETKRLDGDAVIQQCNRLYDPGYAAALEQQGDRVKPFDTDIADAYERGKSAALNDEERSLLRNSVSALKQLSVFVQGTIHTIHVEELIDGLNKMLEGK